jgi:predicted N-acetyltransferase YhbS
MPQNQTAPPVRVRRADPAETPALASVIDRAFNQELAAQLPHLFTPARVPNHIVGEIGGRLVGAVGLYPHQWRCQGVTFDVAGVGQVATLPESRGSGVMSAILQETCRAADRLDFSWLFGDRQRYGRYGWVLGGERRVYEFFDKYLPTPPPREAVTTSDAASVRERVMQALERAPQSMVFPPEEVRMIFEGVRGRGWRAWMLGGTLALTDATGETVHFADGTREELALLLAHLAREVRTQPGDRWKIAVHCSADPSPLHAACLDRYWRMHIAPGANFRVGNLKSFFTKLFSLTQPRLAGGDGRLALRNSDTGEAVTLACRAGRLGVEAGVAGSGSGAAGDAEVRSLTTRELSEVCFGMCPVDLVLPGLPAASPFRQVLPLKVFVHEIFSL